jgi:hypothetical protein
MNHVVLTPVRRAILQRVSLDKRERVARLRHVVHAHHVKPGAGVTDSRATGTAEEIE